jgi:hypothetical protein
MFNSRCGVLFYRVAQFTRAIESMDLIADLVASGHIGTGSQALRRRLRDEPIGQFGDRTQGGGENGLSFAWP